MKEKEKKKDNDAKEDGGKKRRLAEEEYKRLFRKGEKGLRWRDDNNDNIFPAITTIERTSQRHAFNAQ